MYKASGLVRIAKREQNKKRNYLVLNRLQGKHIPVSPGQALTMFEALAEKLKGSIIPGKALLIGFAETATAIGAAAAVKLGTYYMQTTREEVPGAEYLYFSEEHSHAALQSLIKNGLEEMLPKLRQIVFIEDEVTTGNTILNMIDVLQKEYPGYGFSYEVASILNGMDEEALKRYERLDIRLCYLVKTDHTDYPKEAEQYTQQGSYFLPGSLPYRKICLSEYTAFGFMDARRLLNAREYENACLHLWKQLQKQFTAVPGSKILVLGTEEFMYPALFCASMIEKAGADVRFHATTRSPIAVFQEAQYPLHARYELPSLYEKGRRTFLYEISAYNHVLIMTDAWQNQQEGIDALVQAAAVYNENISVVRWKASV